MHVLLDGGRAAPDHALGWRHVQVAEDTVIDLPGLQFKGKAWQDVRTALNRAAKSNVQFRLVRLADESFQMVQQARGISEQWVSDKGLPEMGFTLGGIDEALDPEVRVGRPSTSTASSRASPRGCRSTARTGSSTAGPSTSCAGCPTASGR